MTLTDEVVKEHLKASKKVMKKALRSGPFSLFSLTGDRDMGMRESRQMITMVKEQRKDLEGGRLVAMRALAACSGHFFLVEPI